MYAPLQNNANAFALYLNTQIKAGAQGVMIFDSWGGVLVESVHSYSRSQRTRYQ
ncbi:MAG: hypothetical protein EBT49_04235 [Betaproteobacteria bacterium]|jgi:uroporphyrinogen-III decarboxylase|nr:hypothetical protein [Betaproteobacteria bacterium]